MLYAQVIVKYRTNTQALTYSIPSHILAYLQIGCEVLVPLRRRLVKGVVVEIKDRLGREVLKKDIKPISDITKKGKFTQKQIEAINQLSKYYGASLSEVAFHALKWPNSLIIKEPKRTQKIFYEANWEKRKEFYEKIITKYRKDNNILFIFSQKAFANDFIKSLKLENISTNITSKKKIANMILSNFVLVTTSEGIFFPLQPNDFIIIDQPSHIGAKSHQRPYMTNLTISKIRSDIENLHLIIGDYLIDYESLLLSTKKKITYIKEAFKKISLEIIKANKSQILTEASLRTISYHLSKKENILIINSQKGWANALLCRECGEVIRCKNCKQIYNICGKNKIYCPTCKKEEDILLKCPKCNSKKLVTLGFGSDQILCYLRENYKKASIQQYSDTIVENKLPNILVANEKIFSNPNLRFKKAIILGFDRYLINSDHLSQWKLFNNFRIISERVDSILIETNFIDHTLWSDFSKNTTDVFMSDELKNRKDLLLPPFGQMARLIATTSKKDSLEEDYMKINELLKNIINNVSVMPLRIETRYTNRIYGLIDFYLSRLLTTSEKEVIRTQIPPAWHLELEL